MADNVDITPGTGATVAADDVSGVLFQKVKLDAGGDGLSTPVLAGAGVAASAIRATLASDDPAVSVLGATGTLKVITDASGTIVQFLRGLVYLFSTGLAFVTAAGDVVHDNADSGAPVKIG